LILQQQGIHGACFEVALRTFGYFGVVSLERCLREEQGVSLGQTQHRHHVQNRQHLVPGTGQQRLLPPKYRLLDGFTRENAKYIYMDWIIDLCVIFLVHPGELYLVFQLTTCKKLSKSDETRN
jgi:hypothetical protein